MKPDRTNYEIWLVDYLDGILNDEQAGQLLSFLDDNPDIKEEFDGLSAISLPFSEVSFGNKNSLKRSAADLSDSQIDLLFAASLENDLSAVQIAELEEAICGNKEREKSAQLFSVTKLSPPELSYPHKKKLKKLTPAQKVIRISAIGLSAAATILIMFTIIKNPAVNTPESIAGDQRPATGSRDNRNGETIRQTIITVPGKNKEVMVLPAGTQIAKNIQPVSVKMKSLNENFPLADTSLPINDIQKINITRIGGLTEIPSENPLLNLSLVSMSLTPTVPIDEETDNAVGNFLKRLIREKILKSGAYEKGNLKAYEVADAGITGINKLFGSNMTLQKTIDEKGEVSSVYFNSKLLKFNAPVKKAEPLE
jgi:hypothetical protein